MSLTSTPAWLALLKHQESIGNLSIREIKPTPRIIQACGISFDYTQHLMTDETLPLLLTLAEQSAGSSRSSLRGPEGRGNLKKRIQAAFSGEKINASEDRAVLHTALRSQQQEPLIIDGENIRDQIQQTRQKMADFCNAIHAGELVGATGKPFKYIVNIGIGGSHTGPLLTTEALKDFATNDLKFYFISTIDPALLNDVLDQIDCESTLFIVASKSFGTIETKTNAEHARNWITRRLGQDAIQHHMIGITANVNKAVEFGMNRERLFPMWDWVGGRYSIWSAIGLPLMLMIGPEQFNQFLRGAEQIDQHVIDAPLDQNIPVIMASLNVWYGNFFNTTSHAIIPYSYRLRTLITYLQQAVMESNGKSVSTVGELLDYNTSPVIFGQEGCEGQHTYHQLLHQGTQLIPVDMILIKESFNSADQGAQDILLASALSQAEALRIGKSGLPRSLGELAVTEKPETKANKLAVITNLLDTSLTADQAIPGNKPVTLISIEKLTPTSLGSLLALYEHTIHIEGIIWQINPFDQWGVELGKTLLPAMLNNIQSMYAEKSP